jgi:flavin-dependent dehydrogenase
METNPDVLIIGGGLAGLSAGIHLSREGLSVTIIEKSGYPKHKVCGEYISNEILPYLEWLGIDVAALNPARINKFEFSSMAGNPVTANLPLGGFGISRYALDDFLCQKAVENGCHIVKAQVTEVSFADGIFSVLASGIAFSAKTVLGAYGKRSNIDRALSRRFIKDKSPWLAVKAHYKGHFPNDMVALYNFPGGYCGISKVEDDTINICYLADYDTFKKHKDIEEYQAEVVFKNAHLKTIFTNCTMVFEKPLTISQISFKKKPPVENHMLMIGDTAGLIHPLCGNGMAMAIHSAKIVSALVLDFHSGKISSREKLERHYKIEWQQNFGKRMRMGKLLAMALQNKGISKLLFTIIALFPKVLPKIIKQTHGKPIHIAY